MTPATEKCATCGHSDKMHAYPGTGPCQPANFACPSRCEKFAPAPPVGAQHVHNNWCEPGDCFDPKPVGREGSERELWFVDHKRPCHQYKQDWDTPDVYFFYPSTACCEGPCKRVKFVPAAASAAAEKRAKYFEEAGIEAQREKAAAEKERDEWKKAAAQLQRKLDAPLAKLKEREASHPTDTRRQLQQKLDAALTNLATANRLRVEDGVSHVKESNYLTKKLDAALRERDEAIRANLKLLGARPAKEAFDLLDQIADLQRRLDFYERKCDCGQKMNIKLSCPVCDRDE